jgi:hypothetical protein
MIISLILGLAAADSSPVTSASQGDVDGGDSDPGYFTSPEEV